MSQCEKKRRTEVEANEVAVILTQKNRDEGHPQPEVYPYRCNLCHGHWHITSQTYHMKEKA